MGLGEADTFRVGLEASLCPHLAYGEETDVREAGCCEQEFENVRDFATLEQWIDSWIRHLVSGEVLGNLDAHIALGSESHNLTLHNDFLLVNFPMTPVGMVVSWALGVRPPPGKHVTLHVWYPWYLIAVGQVD